MVAIPKKTFSHVFLHRVLGLPALRKRLKPAPPTSTEELPTSFSTPWHFVCPELVLSSSVSEFLMQRTLVSIISELLLSPFALGQVVSGSGESKFGVKGADCITAACILLQRLGWCTALLRQLIISFKSYLQLCWKPGPLKAKTSRRHLVLVKRVNAQIGSLHVCKYAYTKCEVYSRIQK